MSITERQKPPTAGHQTKQPPNYTCLVQKAAFIARFGPIVLTVGAGSLVRITEGVKLHRKVLTNIESRQKWATNETKPTSE
jgi:hypothetical protein